jgi:3-phenylpropionate/trans-cinnamate dioxygenase ferredoxin reductase subunit
MAINERARRLQVPETFVIVGASLAGATAAEALRDEGFDGRVLLIGDEPERPYERPPLTKDYLRGDAPREQAYVHSESFYGAHDIELMTGTTVAAVNPGRSRITLDDGRELNYDRLLLATGAEPNRLQLPGAALDGVHYRHSRARGPGQRARASWRGANNGAGLRKP